MSAQFGILGPLEVTVDGEPIDLGPPRQRALLALFLTRANRVIATDRILEMHWGDESSGKENALWVYISRLRTMLEPERTGRGESSFLLTEGNGYVLRVEPSCIDAVVFEQEVAEGRDLIATDPQSASEILARALDRWRGDALEEFTYEEFARSEIVRLEELRVGAVEDRIAADLLSGRARGLIGELELLCEAHPLRERPVGHLTLALYRSGRQADALRAIERFRRRLGEELGIEPSAQMRRLEEQVLLQDPRLDWQGRVAAGGVSSAGSVANPFKGLRPFGEDDASRFYGRERLVAEVVRRISADTRLLALVGPSGSGKSSAVRAGVVPAMRKGGHGGDEAWVVAQMVPGAHPFAELEVALLRSRLDTPSSLGDQLAAQETGLLRAALRILPDRDSRLLLVIDQFEELFILVDDEVQRHRFLTQLVTALEDPHGRISVLVTLRSDFYGEPLAHPAFGARLGDGVVNVVPLLPSELESAAREPAYQAGVQFQPALLATLIADVAGASGGLPLFQFTLAELFDRRIDGMLTIETYREMGGLGGGITRRAEELYERLGEVERAAAIQLFLRLVALTDTGQLGRRRVRASEITTLDVDLVALQTVIESYTRNRLLTCDRDHVSGSPTIELAHEALLTEWDRLRRWIDDARDDIRRHGALKVAVEEWLDADRAGGFLLTGSRLEVYEDWASRSTMRLTEDEREYLDTAVRARDEHQSAEEERRAIERRLAASARRRLWGLAAVLLVLVLAAVVFVSQAFGPGPVRVAVLMPNLPEEQEGLARTGTERAARELGVQVEELTGRFTSLEATYRELASGGVDLIFLDNATSGFQWVEEVIADYPETDFAVINGVLAPAGAEAIYFADEEAGYLAGVAAALYSETGVVGFVGNYHSDTSERWRAGFESGARAARPRVEVLAIYTGSGGGGMNHPEAGSAAADELFRRGADVVLAFAGDATIGVIEAASEQFDATGIHRWVIGSESDWSVGVPADLRPHVLTSAIRRWDVAVFDTIRAHIGGDFEPRIRTLGLDVGAVGLTRSEHLTSEHLQEIGDLRDQVAAGRVVIPRAPVGELLTPPGFVASGTLIVTWDGQTCTFTDSGIDPSLGTNVRVDFVNDSPDYWYFFVRHSERGIPISTLVQPGSRNSGYLTLVPGTIDFRCGVETRDRTRAEVASETTTAQTLTVGP